MVDIGKVYYTKTANLLDEKKYSNIPEVFRELCKKDSEVRVLSKSTEGMVLVETTFGTRVVKESELY